MIREKSKGSRVTWGSAGLDRGIMQDTRLAGVEALLSGWRGSLDTSFTAQSWSLHHACALGRSEGTRGRGKSPVHARTNHVASAAVLSFVGRKLRSSAHAHGTSS